MKDCGYVQGKTFGGAGEGGSKHWRKMFGVSQILLVMSVAEEYSHRAYGRDSLAPPVHVPGVFLAVTSEIKP